MANVIKHKRGSGSDPSAGNLVIGELAIRTDTGKLFTKMDSGAIAEIAGGGSDIAINTLSSSSGTGGGSATFNGSAYRFTLSAPPNVSAAQLLVSINGVIQKPVTGTGQPSEGFAVDGTDIILGDAPATGSDFFILTFKSLGVSEPADDSVTSAKIVDGAIVNADINASAAIAGSKIAPDFGSQNIVTTGSISGATGTLTGDLTIPDTIVHTGDTNTKIRFPATDTVSVETAGSERIRVASNGDIGIGTTTLNRRDAGRPLVQFDYSGSDASQGLEVRLSNSAINGNASTDNLQISYIGQDFSINNTENGNIVFYNNGSERFRINSSGNIGIGTTAINERLNIHTASSLKAQMQFTNTTTGTGGGDGFVFGLTGGEEVVFANQENTDMSFATNNTERMRIDSSGNVGIGTSSPDRTIHCHNSSNTTNVRTKFSNGTTGEGASDGFEIGINGSDPAQAVLVNYENSPMAFFTNATERLRIDSSGNVGIGETSPDEIYGTPGSNDMPGRLMFSTTADGSASPTERMRITSSGNVGIGETSPDEILHLKAANPVLEIEGTAGSSGDTGVFLNANGNHWFVRSDNSGSQNTFSIKSGTPSSSTHRLLINSSGNVGIGTSSPNSLLNIHGVFETNAYDSTSGNGGRTSTGLLIGDAYSAGKTSSDDRNSIIWNERGLDIDFATADTVRMKINSSGHVLVNCASLPNSSTQGAGFERKASQTTFFVSAGDTSSATNIAEFYNTNGQVGRILVTGSATSYNTSSDYRLKENATAISDGITRLKTLKPYRFNFKADADTTVDGFFAHEVQSVVPQAISGTKDEVDSDNNPVYQGIDQSKLVPLLVAALQEAIGRIEALEAK